MLRAVCALLQKGKMRKKKAIGKYYGLKPVGLVHLVPMVVRSAATHVISVRQFRDYKPFLSSRDELRRNFTSSHFIFDTESCSFAKKHSLIGYNIKKCIQLLAFKFTC